MSPNLTPFHSMSLYLMSLVFPNLMSLSFHVPVFDILDVPQSDIPFNPCPYILCPLTRSMSLKLISHSFHAPAFHVLNALQINVSFIPCGCIWCPSNWCPFHSICLYLKSLMSLKLVFFSIHVHIFHVPQPIWYPSNWCPFQSMSMYLMSLMSLKLTSLSFHVPVFEVPGVPQIVVPFNACLSISFS